MVLEISTSAVSSARAVKTDNRSENRPSSALPGQSPAARTSGSSVKPRNPGSASSRRRTMARVRSAAAGLVSRSRNASELYPGSPLSAATVRGVA